MMKVQCAVCGEEINRHPYKVSSSKTSAFYCAEHDPHAHAKVEVQCAVCGKDLERCPSVVAKSKSGLFYCDNKCRGRAEQNRITVKCANPACGKSVEVIPARLRPKNYCSLDCYNIAGKVENALRWNREVGRSPATLAKMSLAAANRKPTWHTKGERLISTTLTDVGFEHEPQKSISSPPSYPEGYFNCRLDDYLEVAGLQFAFEANGVYHHADPRRYPDPAEWTDTQCETVERYERKKRLLAHLGIRLVELWSLDNHQAAERVLAPVLLLLACQAVSEEVHTTVSSSPGLELAEVG